jgi:hypothetical protein
MTQPELNDLLVAILWFYIGGALGLSTIFIGWRIYKYRAKRRYERMFK